jgi:prepilin-type N-terminal cleavage/methylation domain-containing protein
MNRISKSNASGLTLVEVLVASAIMAFCLAGLLLTYINLLTLTDVTGAFTLANNAAQQKMEEIKHMSFDNVNSTNPTSPFSVEGFTGTDGTGYIDIAPTNYTFLKKVRILVSFRVRNRLIGNATGSPVEVVTYIGNYSQ